MFGKILLFFGLVYGLNEMNIINEDDGITDANAAFVSGSALIPRLFNSSMKFEFENGISKITFQTRNKDTITVGTTSWYDPNKVDGRRPPQFRLDQKGLFYIEYTNIGQELTSMLINTPTEHNIIENGKFYVQLEYDFRIRIRMQSDSDIVLWEHPKPRPMQKLLDSYAKNWISGNECLGSKNNGKYTLCINGNGQLVTSTGLMFSSPTIIENDPRVFVMHNNGSFGFYDYQGKSVPLKGMDFRGNDENIDYIASITDEGIFTITERNDPSKTYWALDISNTKLKENQVCSSGDKCTIGLTCCLSDKQDNTICRKSDTCPRPFVKENQVCSSSDKCENGLSCCLSDKQDNTICRKSDTCPRPFVKKNQECSPNDKCENDLSCCLNDSQDRVICRTSDTCPRPFVKEGLACTPDDKCENNMSCCYGFKDFAMKCRNECVSVPTLEFKQIYNYRKLQCIDVNENGILVSVVCSNNNKAAIGSDGFMRFSPDPTMCVVADGNLLKLGSCEDAIKVEYKGSKIYVGSKCLDDGGNDKAELTTYDCSPFNQNQVFGYDKNYIDSNNWKELKYGAIDWVCSTDYSVFVDSDKVRVEKGRPSEFALNSMNKLVLKADHTRCLSIDSNNKAFAPLCESATTWSTKGDTFIDNSTKRCLDLFHKSTNEFVGSWECTNDSAPFYICHGGQNWSWLRE
jgi:hypothetical protein